LLVAGALVIAAAASQADTQTPADITGVTGSVLGPDGVPVDGGSVLIGAEGLRHIALIDRAGRFHFSSPVTGPLNVWVEVPSFAPYRLIVIVPPSRTVKLPPIHLAPATYFRARFVTAAGEPITAPRLRRLSVDLSGAPILLPGVGAERLDAEGAIMIGPLPTGFTMLALDHQPYAITRLPDLEVTGTEAVLDGGTIVVQQGAVLHVDVTESSGGAVVDHEVILEDAAAGFSALPLRRGHTDQQGRVLFDRLGAGRYRLRTTTAGRCGPVPLSVVRLVSVPGSGQLRTQLVVSGSATFKLRSPLGDVAGAPIAASPSAGEVAPPAWRRPVLGLPPPMPLPLNRETPCRGRTAADGRATLETFPPGPARLNVHFHNSTYSRAVTVPDAKREIVVDIPEGLLSVRVTDASSGKPVGGAAISWTASGARVEARTTATGDALLESVANSPGVLGVEAQGYQPLETKVAEPLGELRELAIRPAPPPRLNARVVSESGAPLPGAVVELSSANAMQPRVVAVADAKGEVTFAPVPSGGFRLTASADGHVSAGQPVANDHRDGIVLRLVVVR
jgi:protocatechuate 3,4-dioxygenase beta subunit